MYLRDKDKLFFFTETCATYIFESYFIKNHKSLECVQILALPFPADWTLNLSFISNFFFNIKWENLQQAPTAVLGM